MRNFPVQLILVAFCITFVACDTQRINSFQGSDFDRSADSDTNLDKRLERYAFGLGRRAYTYTAGGNGVKRLPVYNFGLGKRGRPYSFGLGKRAGFDEDYLEGRSANYGSESVAEEDKRGRPYSFGLGKRGDINNDFAERRMSHPAYDFGLGRR